MTNFEELSIKAILPDTIKAQLNDGSLKLEGLQLRDSRGRYTTPLNTLMVKEACAYSPALMVQFQNEFLVSLSLINRNIRAEFREQSEKLSRIERKLDQLITNEMDKLNAEVNFFFSEIADLDENDHVRAERLLFEGSKTAALLAQKMGQFMDEYIDSMELRNLHNSNILMTYGEYKEGPTNKYSHHSSIAVYRPFKGSSAEVYTCAFLEMLNSLNILSLIYRARNTPDYLINLETVKDKLVKLLKALAVDDLQKYFGHEYPGFRDMCYQGHNDYQNNQRFEYRGNPEAERLSVYFSEFSSNALAVRECIRENSRVYQDDYLHHAITAILDMLESIENLKARASILPDTKEERSQAISALSEKFYLFHNSPDSAIAGRVI